MVGVMGVMLILAAIGVVAAIIHKAKQKSLPNAGNVVVACQPQRVALPEGARILDSRVEDGKVIILHLGYVNGSEAWQRIDWCSGTVTADVTLGNGEKIVD